MMSCNCPTCHYAEVEVDMIKVGDTYTGWDVTLGGYVTGTVIEVIKAMPYSGGSVRYKLVDTGKFYSNGRPIEPIVYA